MESKKGLNNTQRKMLDEVYMAQFQEKARTLRAKRDEAFAELKKKVLAEEVKAHSALLKAGEEYAKLYRVHKDELYGKGITIPSITEVKLSFGYSSNTHPAFEEFKKESARLEAELNQKKTEIRARIYGMDTTFEEVEKDIAQELASINV